MSKHIIDFPDGVEWGVVTCRTEDGFYTRDFDFLEELNSDYINEHFSELQDMAYQRGYKACMSENDFDSPCTSCEAYQRGLNDACEAARKIIRMPEGKLLNIFTECYSAVCTALQVLLKYDASEAIEKLKAYEEKQKADELKVGDELEHTVSGYTSKAIFLEKIKDDEDWYKCLFWTGCGVTILTYPKRQFKRTGRHFDIDKILEEMRHD